MILRRSRRFTVNMGNYESYSFGCDVEMGHRDLNIDDIDLVGMTKEDRDDLWSRLEAAVLERMNEQVTEEIRDSVELTQNQKTFLLRDFGASPAKKKPVRKKTTRRRSNA